MSPEQIICLHPPTLLQYSIHKSLLLSPGNSISNILGLIFSQSPPHLSDSAVLLICSALILSFLATPRPSNKLDKEIIKIIKIIMNLVKAVEDTGVKPWAHLQHLQDTHYIQLPSM